LKKRTFQILKIIIALAAYGYIAWKVYDYRLHAHHFFSNYHFNTLKVTLLAVVFLLMPFNWLLEALKWKKLVENFTAISLKHSFKAVLAGISTGIFTPNRIGEFAGRPYFTDKNKITSGVFAGFAGSLAQSLMTVFMGVLALNLYLVDTKNSFFTDIKILWGIILFSSILLGIIFYLFFHLKVLIGLKKYFPFLKKHSPELNFLNHYSKKNLLKILFFSLSRYLIFFLQYFFLLHAFEVNINILQAFISIALVYLFLFAVPSVAFSEMGIRGSLAVFFIGMYSTNLSGILTASVLLWLINLAFPAVLGTIFVFSSKE